MMRGSNALTESVSAIALRVDLLGIEKRIDNLLRKFNPSQPRDEKGRWAETGIGTGVAPGQHLAATGAGSVVVEGDKVYLGNYEPKPANSASQLFERTHDSSITEGMIINSVPGAGDAIARTEAQQAESGADTQQLYSKNGVYTSERAAVHKEILGDIFTEEAIAKARPEDGEQPTFVVLGGRAGAGKSWFTKSDESPIDPDKFLVLNSDDIKEALPEYKGWNAGALHEESSDLVGIAHGVAREAGLNVVFDATCRSTGTVGRLVDEYKARGYRIEGYFMHTAPQVSAVRAMNRFMSSGRYVPPSYILSSTTNEISFDFLTPDMDNWAVYDNNTSRGPVKVAQK